MDTVLANITVSVTELKRDFTNILKEMENTPVAVMNHNRPAAYLLSADYYEQLLTRMEDLEDAKLVRERADGPFIQVELNGKSLTVVSGNHSRKSWRNALSSHMCQARR
jgi:antitoxin StbD